MVFHYYWTEQSACVSEQQAVINGVIFSFSLSLLLSPRRRLARGLAFFMGSLVTKIVGFQTPNNRGPPFPPHYTIFGGYFEKLS